MRAGGAGGNLVILALIALGLLACSPLPYSVGAPKSVQRELKRPAAQEALERPGVPYAISLCYSDLINTPRELMDEARLSCRNGTLKYYGTDTLWTPCSLQQPARATFLCTRARDASAAPPAPR